MTEHRPRLGAIVDDYCSRERRISDHAVVAMVGDEIKQTRCTTCDEEHPYKAAKVPAARKKKKSLYTQVLASKDGPGKPAASAAKESGDDRTAGVLTRGRSAPEEPEAPEAPEVVLPSEPDQIESAAGRVHRRLIRATLPRPEGYVPQPRPLPEFTVRQSGSVDGQHRDGDSRRQKRGGGSSNGNVDRQPSHRRSASSKSRRSNRGPAGHGHSPGNSIETPNGRPRSRSRRSRSSSRNKNRTK